MSLELLNSEVDYALATTHPDFRLLLYSLTGTQLKSEIQVPMSEPIQRRGTSLSGSTSEAVAKEQ